MTLRFHTSEDRYLGASAIMLSTAMAETEFAVFVLTTAEDTVDIIYNVIHGTDVLSMRCEIAIQFGNKFVDSIQKRYVPFTSSPPLSFRCFALAELRILSCPNTSVVKKLYFCFTNIKRVQYWTWKWIMRFNGTIF